MLDSLYSIAAHMSGHLLQQEVIANNLANANTVGFKRDTTSFAEVLRAAAKQRGPAVEGTSVVDLSEGSVVQTGNATDLALEGDGFFAVQGTTGAAFTRRGEFSLDAAGHLVLNDGSMLLGEKGPLTIKGSSFSVDESGQVLVDGSVTDSLKLVALSSGALPTKLGNCLFTGPAQPAQTRPKVRQGYVEQSNVNTVKEMAQMIAVFRQFEASQRVLRIADDTLAKAVNEVGRVG